MKVKTVSPRNPGSGNPHLHERSGRFRLNLFRSAFTFGFGVIVCAAIAAALPVAANAVTVTLHEYDNLGNVTSLHACMQSIPDIDFNGNLACYNLPVSSPGAFTVYKTYQWFYADKYWDIDTEFVGTYFANQNLDLKYQIASVVYSVPGQQSYVEYTNGSMLGTSTTNSTTWSAGVTETDNVSAKFSLFGIIAVGAGGSQSFGLTQTQTTSSTVTLQESATTSIRYPGPLSSAAGLDHDYDCTLVWLDPVSDIYAASATNIMWTGYSNNPSDTVNGVDSVCVYEMWLENPSEIGPQAPGVEKLLQRTWDTSGLGGLTSSDYAQILSADPFAENSAYNPNDTSRFSYLGYIMQYEPAPEGGQPITDTQTIQVQTSSSATNSSQTSYTVGYTADTDANFFVGNSFSVSGKYTTTDGWSSTVNNGTTYDATVSLTGPTYSADYTGPIDFQVWRDNVYGTLMLYPVND